MKSVYTVVHERLNRFLRANALLSQDAMTGDDILHLSDNEQDFRFEGLNRQFPTLVLVDENTTGERSSDGTYVGAEIVEVLGVDLPTKRIMLASPLTGDWLTSAAAKVYRAPVGLFVKRVVMGDLAVVTDYPTVCVVPVSKSVEWYTLQSTNEHPTIDIVAYVTREDTEQGTLDLMDLMETIQWVMMSNLHLHLDGNPSEIFSVTSAALVGDVSYGTIQKGEEFLKAGKMTWRGDVHVARDYLVGNPTYYKGV